MGLTRTIGGAIPLAIALPTALADGAMAQGTGSVSSPVVRPGTSVSMAIGFASDEGETGHAHRMDVRHAVSERLRLSAIIFYNDRGGDYRFRRMAVDGLYQIASDRGGWSSAVQIRGRLPDGNDGPGRVRMAWLNRWRPVGRAELRLIGLASREFGDDRSDGIALETRAEATWPIAPGTRAGVQMFNRYNSTDDFGSFDSQRHAVGGVLKGPLSDRLSYRINALAGVSDRAEDFELRVRIRLSL